jgi:uncharacterized cupin superfamily protein
MLFTNRDDSALTEMAAGSSEDISQSLMMQIGFAEENDFQASPLPVEWILAGNPEARSLPLARSADGMFTCGRWECTAGKFKFFYACDEIVHILDGKVTIEEGGQTRTLQTGDVAFFPQGLTTIWTVHGYVRKFAIFRSKPRSLLRRIAGKIKRTLQTIISRITHPSKSRSRREYSNL